VAALNKGFEEIRKMKAYLVDSKKTVQCLLTTEAFHVRVSLLVKALNDFLNIDRIECNAVPSMFLLLDSRFHSLGKRRLLSLETALVNCVCIVVVVVDGKASQVLHDLVQLIEGSSASRLESFCDPSRPETSLHILRGLLFKQALQEVLAYSRHFLNMINGKLLPATGLLPEKFSNEKRIEVANELLSSGAN
jgi:hypothetical protein